MVQKLQPMIQHIACLYVCVCEVMKMNQYYQYSCEWFMRMFCECVKECPPCPMVDRRNIQIM